MCIFSVILVIVLSMQKTKHNKHIQRKRIVQLPPLLTREGTLSQTDTDFAPLLQVSGSNCSLVQMDIEQANSSHVQ